MKYLLWSEWDNNKKRTRFSLKLYNQNLEHLFSYSESGDLIFDLNRDSMWPSSKKKFAEFINENEIFSSFEVKTYFAKKKKKKTYFASKHPEFEEPRAIS